MKLFINGEEREVAPGLTLAALLEQLRTNLAGLGVGSVRTEVSWDDQTLLGFFHRQGFRPAARICLDLDPTAPPRAQEETQ